MGLFDINSVVFCSRRRAGGCAGEELEALFGEEFDAVFKVVFEVVFGCAEDEFEVVFGCAEDVGEIPLACCGGADCV